MISLDHQYFPFIYLNVAVDRYGEGISTLTKANFQVAENGFSQTGTAYFNVIPPESGDTNQRPVDIIFLMDNSGSMSGEQNAVRQNVEAFVDELRNRGVDCQLGLCRFGASQNGGNPIIEDNGSLTAEVDYFKDNVWNRNVTSGGFEPGWDALYAAVTDFAFRKEGPQKVFILITDETPTGDGNVGAHSKEETIAILQDHYITTFALIVTSDNHAISDYGEIAEQTNGAYYNILDPFDGILNYISNLIPNNYRISYKSSNPVFDNTERHVEVTVTYQGDQATCDGKYTPGSAPIIRRTQDTLDLHKQSWAAGTDFTIKAEITDAVEPYVESATLYYRNAGDSDFTPASMTHSSDIWVGSIPGSAVETPWVGYYILATDGENTVTDPSVDPMIHPYILGILPNEAPQIIHTPPADVPDDTPITITAQIVDTTNALASTMLYYRKVGDPLYYDNGHEMNNTGGNNYQDIIPRAFVTPAGVEYYILAVDDLGTENSFGTRDDPQQVWISTNKPPKAEIKTHVIDSANGTAKFTWSGSDDSTPPAQLVYEHRLLNPDSPLYGWSEWDSSTTATYPRAPDTRLPDGTYRFQVKAKDADEAVQPSPTTYKFTIGAGALQCNVELRKQGTTTPIGTVDVNDPFDIYVGDSTGEITSVLFSSDDSQDGKPTGQWKGPYSWDSVQGDWNGNAKTMSWTFTTKGEKEVWVEIYNGQENKQCSDEIFAGRVPVIIIPGFLGSELFCNGKLFWLSPTLLAEPIPFVNRLDRLKLRSNGLSPADSRYVVTQGDDIIRSIEVPLRVPSTPSFGTLGTFVWEERVVIKDYFSSLIEHLKSFGYEEGSLHDKPGSLYVFPYDWRLDLRISALRLGNAIKWVLKNNNMTQVDIIAHSTGGLVSRYYLNHPATSPEAPFYKASENVRKLILIGVPNQGTTESFKALHPKLGNPVNIGPLYFLTPSHAQEIAANWPSLYQLLPNEKFFDLYAPNDYIFVDAFSNPVAQGALRTPYQTYSDNPEGDLPNQALVARALNEFQPSLTPDLQADVDTLLIVGSGVPTERYIEKSGVDWDETAISTPPVMFLRETWTAYYANGDGTVPLESARGLTRSDGQRLATLYVDLRDDGSHAELPSFGSVPALVAAALQGQPAPEDQRLAAAPFPCAVKTTVIRTDSPVQLHVFDSAGGHTGPDKTGQFIEEGCGGSSYSSFGHSSVVTIPADTDLTVLILGEDEGTFTLTISRMEGNVVVNVYSYSDIPVMADSVGTLQVPEDSEVRPDLLFDSDGDGAIDQSIVAEPGNTPLGLTVTLSFYDGRITVSLAGITSAGHTVCGSADTLDTLDPSFKAVSPFYFLSTSAGFSGPASITIRYEESRVPNGRENDLKLYRISGEGTIEDITQKLDQAANTVTGQTDEFSYFVVGYMNASPETLILSPTTGGTVTGQLCSIQWQTTDPDNPVSSLLIDLFYSTNGGTTWASIASNEANDGVYDWNISALQGGEYWLKLVAEDPEGGTSEATIGPFTISVFEGNIIVGPNPVTNTGTAFFYTLLAGTSTAKLMVFNAVGRPVFETSLDVDSSRFPETGTWDPVDQDGVPLANGPYVYVLIADGRAIGQGKMVIQR